MRRNMAEKRKRKRGKQPPPASVVGEVELLKAPEEVQELLQLLTKAFSGDPVDIESAHAAVLEVLDKYDIKVHTFLIAVARAKFERITRTLNFLDKIENRLFTEVRMENATTFELLQMEKVAQSNMIESLGFIERVLKLREQMDPASAARVFTDALSQSADFAEVELLTPAQRDKARTALSRLLGDGTTDGED